MMMMDGWISGWVRIKGFFFTSLLSLIRLYNGILFLVLRLLEKGIGCVKNTANQKMIYYDFGSKACLNFLRTGTSGCEGLS